MIAENKSTCHHIKNGYSAQILAVRRYQVTLFSGSHAPQFQKPRSLIKRGETVNCCITTAFHRTGALIQLSLRRPITLTPPTERVCKTASPACRVSGIHYFQFPSSIINCLFLRGNICSHLCDPVSVQAVERIVW